MPKNTNKPSKVTKKKTTKVLPSASPSSTTTAPSLSGAVVLPKNDVAVSEIEQKKIQEMIMLANIEFAKIKNKITKEKKREIDSLDSQIREFLGPYMLIGYDLNNNPVEIVSTNNAAENDALLERFRRVMYKINQNIANSNGEDPYGNSN